MTQSAAHPCLSCRLPDCDDRSPRCELRRAANRYASALKRRQPVSPDLHAAAMTAHYELWDIERRARQSEAGK